MKKKASTAESPKPATPSAAGPVAMGAASATRRACVVGAGLGGLALAIRLQAAGIDTTVIEARAQVGGCASVIEQDGLQFESGPMVLTDPDSLRELWALSGHVLDDDVTLLPVNPLCRYNWPDGTQFDWSGDEAAMVREVARIAPQDLAGFDDLMRYGEAVRRDGFAALADGGSGGLSALARRVQPMVRNQAWRSLYGMVAHHVQNQHLREALTAPALLHGANPVEASALWVQVLAAAMRNGGWCVQGGMRELTRAMVAHFGRLGGVLRLHDPVSRIHTVGNRASEIETESGWRGHFDAVASNADLMQTYRKLLGDDQRGRKLARKLARRRWSCGLFVVHFAVEGSWPGIPHQMMLFGPRYRALLADIFDHGVLAQDMMIALHHPTITDPSLAPPGKSLFQAVVPVANRAQLPIDWEVIGPMLEQRVLDEIGRRLIPDLPDRIITRFHQSPRDFAMDLNSWAGSAFGPYPSRLQDGALRLSNRDNVIRNFYLVGAGVRPGAGVPGVIASARLTARQMLEGMK